MKEGEIVFNEVVQGDYYKVGFYVPEICEKAEAGQFVHVRIDETSDRILRRPFSINDVSEDGVLTVVYKVVGDGTERLSQLKPGATCSLMGPQGKGFSKPQKGDFPILVVGGYGSAATYLIAKNSSEKGIALIGARSKEDILLVDQYKALGYEPRVSTDDGSLGIKGLVTELIDGAIEAAGSRRPVIYACGPTGMLLALAKMLEERGVEGELSLDHLMCCGVGACFACVVKVKCDENPDGWRYSRSCYEGPVYEASEVYVE